MSGHVACFYATSFTGRREPGKETGRPLETLAVGHCDLIWG